MSLFSKIVTFLCISWVLYVVSAYVYAYSSAKSIEEYLSADCPSLNIHVFPNKMSRAIISRKKWVELIAWYDKNTGHEISITTEAYKHYRQLMSCDKKRINANLVKIQIATNQIEPYLKPKFGYLIGILFVPVFLAAGLLIVPFELRKKT